MTPSAQAIFCWITVPPMVALSLVETWLNWRVVIPAVVRRDGRIGPVSAALALVGHGYVRRYGELLDARERRTLKNRLAVVLPRALPLYGLCWLCGMIVIPLATESVRP